MPTQGLESVLRWSVFESLRPAACLFAEESQPNPETLPPPPLQYSELVRLKNKYVAGIHDKNPFIDLDELQAMIMNVAENGPDWSTQTCLVSLVCALGAATEPYTSPGEALDEPLSEKNDVHLSRQLWAMGVKRLGLSLGRNDVASVQCLCLAGVWYMHNLQPLDAWKHFNIAESSWHCLQLIDSTLGNISTPASDCPKSFTVWQSMYFTIWKSQCELMLELPLPYSNFDSSKLPAAFPTPPTPSSDRIMGAAAAEAERRWYYYLADIAARHLLNRLVQTKVEPEGPLTAAQIQDLLHKANLMEVQIQNWHTSLPEIFHFDVPTGLSLEPHPDDMTQILRNRYLVMRDIVGRQFVRVCVEQPLEQIDPTLREEVISFASQSVQFCMIKLSQVKAHRHQGSWFMLRNTTTSSLVLCAVYLAQQIPWRTGARAITLPNGWMTRISEAHEKIGPFWNEPHGGSRAMQNLLQTCLAACTETPTPASGSRSDAYPHTGLPFLGGSWGEA